MATIYVDDDGSNTSPYDTWAKAATTLATALSAWTAGNDIWVADDHYESFSSTATWDWTGNSVNPTRIYSYTSGTTTYSAASSAQFETTTADYMRFLDYVVLYGIYLKSGTYIQFAQGTYLEDCTFEVAQAASTSYSIYAGGHPLICKNCAIKNGVTYIVNRGLLLGNQNIYEGCDVDLYIGGAPGALIDRGTGGGIVRGCDFSGCSGTGNDFISVTGYGGWTDVHNCNYPSSGYSYDSSSGSGLTLWTYSAQAAAAIDGSTTGKLYNMAVETPMGDTLETATIYRNAGFVDADGDTPIGHIMTPDNSACAPDRPLHGPMLMGYYGSTGSVTVRVEALYNFSTAPTKDNLWIEVYYLGTTNSTLWSFAGGRAIGSSANWSSSTVDWTGAGGYTKIKLEQAVTINKAGPYAVRVFCGNYEAGPKTIVYCPKVEIDT